MPVAVHPGQAGSNPAISHYFCRATFFAVFATNADGTTSQVRDAGSIPAGAGKRRRGSMVRTRTHCSIDSCRRIFFPASAGWQRMPRVLHFVAGSSPASRKAVAQSVEQMCLFPCRCPQAWPAPIDPANAGGTTGQRGRGFESRSPQGAGSEAERAACSTFTCRRLYRTPQFRRSWLASEETLEIVFCAPGSYTP